MPCVKATLHSPMPTFPSERILASKLRRDQSTRETAVISKAPNGLRLMQRGIHVGGAYNALSREQNPELMSVMTGPQSTCPGQRCRLLRDTCALGGGSSAQGTPWLTRS